jgi:hypothetical protein
MSETNKKTGTEFEKFSQFAKQVVSVPKAEIDRREAEYQKARKQEKKRRKS